MIPREHLVSETKDDYKRFEEVYEVDFISHGPAGAKIERKSLPPSVLMSKRDFNAYLAHVNPLAWSGTDDQVQSVRTLLRDYCVEHHVPVKKMTFRVGVRKSGAVVTHEGSFKWTGGYTIGPDPGAPVYAASATHESNASVLDVLRKRGTKIDLDAIRTFATNATRQSAPCVAWLAAGWMAAGPFRDCLREFPTLQFVGSRGSGKSSIIRRWKEALAGSEVSVGGMPRYSQAKELSANTSFPVIFEEFRESKLRPSAAQSLRDNVRDLYTRQTVARSGLKTLRLESPLCIVGEHEVARGGESTDGATLQRMVFGRPETTMFNGTSSEVLARRAAYKALLECPIEDSAMHLLYPCWGVATFGGQANEWVAVMRAEIDAYVDSLPQPRRRAVDERTSHNLSVVMFGAFVWSKWCEFVGADPGSAPSVAQLCATTIATVTGAGSDEAPDEQADPLARYIEALSVLLAEVAGGASPLAIAKWWLREGDSLFIDVTASLAFYRKHGGNDSTFSLPANMYQFARESPYVELHPKTKERFRKSIPGSGVKKSRCFAVNIPKLEEASVTLAEAFVVGSSASSEGGF